MVDITLVNRGSFKNDPAADDAYDAFGDVNTSLSNLETAVDAIEAAYLKKDGSVALTANWDVGSFSLTMASLVTDTITEESAGSGVTVDGLLVKDQTLLLVERADHVNSFPNATYGEIWVKNDTPNSLMYTDDAGNDYDLTDVVSSEVNDLTAAVTWANVPDANITQTSVTQHQAALSITESQISDLGTTVAMVADNLSVFAATTSAQLAGVISDETGSGALVFGTSPSLTTPDLGTPSALTLTNATGLPEAQVTQHEAALSITESQISDLGTTVAMVADNLSVFAATTSAQLAGVISDETGSGALVFGTSPTIATPTLTLKQGAAPAPTAEGDIQWDTDDNTIKVGDSVGTKTFSDDSVVLARANHTGTQTLSTISDSGALAALNTVGTTEIDNDAVTYAKIQNVVADDRILGNVAGAGGVVAELTAAQVRTMINVEDGATASGAFSADGQTQITPSTAITLDEATGEETALDLSMTVNKATSGDWNLIYANVTETSAPGTDNNLLQLQTASTDRFRVDEDGALYMSGAVGSGGGYIYRGVDDGGLALRGSNTTGGKSAINLYGDTYADAGIKGGIEIAAGGGGYGASIWLNGTTATDAYDFKIGWGARALNFAFHFDYSEKTVQVGNGSWPMDLLLVEQADHNWTPTAGLGSIWLKSDTPNSLIFTDDAGTDYDLTDTAAASHTHTEDDITVSTNNILLGRTTAGGGAVEELDISSLTEETAPAAGDWLLGEESGGNIRKFDVGDLPDKGFNITQKTATYTAVAGDFIVYNGLSGNVDCDLPATFAVDDNPIWVHNADDTSYVSIDPAASDTLYVGGDALAADDTILIYPGMAALIVPRTANATWEVTIFGQRQAPMVHVDLGNASASSTQTIDIGDAQSWYLGISGANVTIDIDTANIPHDAVCLTGRVWVHLNGAYSGLSVTDDVTTSVNKGTAPSASGEDALLMIEYQVDQDGTERIWTEWVNE